MVGWGLAAAGWSRVSMILVNPRQQEWGRYGLSDLVSHHSLLT